MKLPPPITPATFEKRVSLWLKPLTAGESGCIMFCPKMDRYRRINQLLASKAILKKYLGKLEKFQFLILECDFFHLEDPEDFDYYLTLKINQQTGKKFANFSQSLAYLKKQQLTLVIFVANAEKLLEKPLQPALAHLISLIEQDSVVRSLFFLEVNIISQENLPLVSAKTGILQNIIYSPLYEPKDVNQFINYLGVKWQLKIPPKLKEAIIKRCGGHFLLVKQAVRHFRDQPQTNLKEIFFSEAMTLRLELISAAFSFKEKTILIKIANGSQGFNKKEDKTTLNYLTKIGIINLRHQITVPLFAEYLKGQEKTSHLVLQDNQLLINKVPVEDLFSRQEKRVLKKMLNQSGKIINRDALASVIWPSKTDQHYSDWAIDQLVKRLRKKLANLNLNPKIIKTVRSQGYLLDQNINVST